MSVMRLRVWHVCALGSIIAGVLKLTTFLFDANEHVESRGGTTNVSPDRET